MSPLAFLVTELQSLSSKTRRKHPDIRELRSELYQNKQTGRTSDGLRSLELLKPIFMGCATKKLVAISLGSLQRLISLKIALKSTVPEIIRTMSDAMNQGVDIQLKILQTLLGLIAKYLEVHDALLGDLVMVVMNKMVHEDRKNADVRTQDVDDKLTDVTLPDGTTTHLNPSAKDAYSVFEDLCLLANSDKSNFPKLEFLREIGDIRAGVV
ncbi:hypothetical protein FB446DRAFT_795385 [Lentinula raphanica]|nr:hypothetical protein FB446DRAFT_795385 [Lentinula raphanica]